MENKILKLGSTVFWINNENKIERVVLKEYKLTLNGGEYLIERSSLCENQEIFVSENELYENQNDIDLINFKDFFILEPIYESDGLNGRGFPWNKTSYTYFAIYKVVNITGISIYKDCYNMGINVVPFGIITSKELTYLDIPITRLKKDSSFIECKETHLQTIHGFNKNIAKLFKKITYNSVDMNKTSCKLVGGGGYSFDPNEKTIQTSYFEYNKSFEEFIVNANLKTDKIFPKLYYYNDETFHHIIASDNGDYSINEYTKYGNIKKVVLVTKIDDDIPETITYNGIQNLKVILEKHGDINEMHNSAVIPGLTIYNMKLVTENALDIINSLNIKNEKLIEENQYLKMKCKNYTF